MADLSLESYWQLPPLSRTLATAAFLLSIGVHLGFMPGWWFVFYPQLIWKMPPQLWRFGTAFLLTGPNLSLLFDTYFLYSYLSQLEIGNPRFPRKEDLVWYLMFVGGTIMVSSCLCSAHPRLCFRDSCASPNLCCINHTSSICPDSELPPQLSRFLNMRKSTPALRTVHHSQNQDWSAVWAWWMSYGWLV